MRAAGFAMSDRNHFTRVLSLAGALADAGAEVAVFSDRAFAAEVEAAGATLIDVFGPYPLAAADDASRPLPARNVTWAATFGEDLAGLASGFAPDVVFYDSFAVAGRLVAERLGVPSVALVSGHAQDPAMAVPRRVREGMIDVSDACLRAVAVLRDRYGWARASPLSYLDCLSPDLNLVAEPAAYLTEDERRPFAPCAFWGGLTGLDGAAGAPRVPRRPGRVYASAGTIVWRYHVPEALAFLHAVVSAFAGAEVVIGLGRAPLADADVDALRRPGVRVERWADQWSELAAADLCVTHGGMNTAHEALAHGVPLVTAPFGGDQPGMAARLAELGVAVTAGAPLARPVTAADLRAATDALFADPEALGAALAVAQEREREVVAARPAVVERIRALARAGRPARPGPR